LNIFRIVLVASLCWGNASLGVVTLRAEEMTTGLAKWEAEIQKFEAADKVKPPVPGGVVFYGSSSARMWDLPASFPKMQTLNRGFGGSDMAAAAHFYERVVPQHQPRVVVLYEGDNDLAAGRTADQILAEFETLVTKHRAALPEAKMICLTIKYCPSRAKLRMDQEAGNALLKARCARDPHLLFVDLASTLLDDEGQPQPKYFKPDMLHLNSEGYAVWNAKLRPVLEEALRTSTPSP
jgi:lysophospholipase L1-like esterase